MAQIKASLRLFFLFLIAVSYLVSSAAIPTTRKIKPNKEDPSAQDLLVPDALVKFKDGNDHQGFDIGDGFMEVRMDFETADYKPAGPNKGHEPKTPGRA